MSSQNLTKEQQDFLEECLLEFSDRYTDSDLEYKETYDAGIPAPPIMHPWYGRPKLTARRDRDRDGDRDRDNQSGRGYRSGYRERRFENNSQDRDQYREDDRDRDRRHQDYRRYKPY